VSCFSFPGADRNAGSPLRRYWSGRRARWALAAAALACSGPPGAAGKLGDDLGTFHVAANQLTNDCGAGALGATASFAFDVELQRDYTQLFWNGQSGRFESGNGFDIAAVVRVPLGTASSTATSCVIERDDHISGTLESDAGDGFQALTATLSYSFVSDPTTQCTLDAQAQAGLPDLPCSMNYALRGQRTRVPVESNAPVDAQTPAAVPPQPPSNAPR
jgi:hypothetical protein